MFRFNPSADRLGRMCRCLGLVAALLPLATLAQNLDSPAPANDARIYLLGEIHDNPHGHRMRLEQVMQLIAQGPMPLVAMEQFDREQQPALDQALTHCKAVDCVLAQAGGSGWAWPLYKPYVQLALDRQVKLVAANVSNADVRKVMTEGFSAVFNPSTMAEYQLHQIPPALRSAQGLSIQEGHCNQLPARALGPMVAAQIARDVGMAMILNGAQNQRVILIAGNGHVRKDAGVFHWLSRANQAQTQVHGYVEHADGNDPQWFDHVHEIAPAQREDPCQVFLRK